MNYKDVLNRMLFEDNSELVIYDLLVFLPKHTIKAFLEHYFKDRMGDLTLQEYISKYNY